MEEDQFCPQEHAAHTCIGEIVAVNPAHGPSWNNFYLINVGLSEISSTASVCIFDLACSLLKLIQLAIKALSDLKAIITILKDICEHGREHHAEQCWCQ